jgi:hypothetical protein
MQQKRPRWRLVLGKMFLGVAIALNNVLGGALGGQIVELPDPEAPNRTAPPADPSRAQPPTYRHTPLDPKPPDQHPT